MLWLLTSIAREGDRDEAGRKLRSDPLWNVCLWGLGEALQTIWHT